jgi:DNA-binding transcriptional LysR family regulator
MICTTSRWSTTADSPPPSALGIPKSRLSRRISQLETDLGVRLLQRSTRRFAVTDVGTSVHRHAQTMLAEAQAAREVVDRLSAEPRGVVRASVPVSLAQMQLPKLLPKFLSSTRRCACS